MSNNLYVCYRGFPTGNPYVKFNQFVRDRRPNIYGASAMLEGDRENSCGAGQNISSAKAAV